MSMNCFFCCCLFHLYGLL